METRQVSVDRSGEICAVDEKLPPRRTVVLAIQHVLVVAAAPISSVFLLSKSFGLGSATTVDLLTAAFVMCGIGALVQSLGIWRIGVRMPFVMLQGGAPLIVFIAIAKQYDLRVATGAVFITVAAMLLFLPVFVQLLRFFPTVVLGSLIVIIGINVVSVAARLVTGPPDTPQFGATKGFGLALATIVLMVIFWRLLRGAWKQVAVLLGLIAGALLSVALGQFGQVGGGSMVGVPSVFPLGSPVFNFAAAIPLIAVGMATMAEATGQTAIVGDIVGKKITPRRDVPRLIIADILTSGIGALFGTSLLVTSGENVGLVQISGVRSRFVTATAGVLLIGVGVFTPVARLINGIPSAVVGGVALTVYAVITVMGIKMLSRVDFTEHSNVIIVSVSLGVGLLPIVVTGAYAQFPAALQNILGSGVAMTAITAVVLNLVFNHLRIGRLPSLALKPSSQVHTETESLSR